MLSLGGTELIAVVGSDGATLYPAPNVTSGSSLAVGTALTALERTADSTMLYVNTSDGASGWVMVDEVVAFNTRSLPIHADAMSEAGMEPVAAGRSKHDSTGGRDRTDR